MKESTKYFLLATALLLGIMAGALLVSIIHATTANPGPAACMMPVTGHAV